MKIIVLMFFLPTTLFAAQMYDNIQVVRNENTEVYLTAKCDTLESKIQSLIVLNKKIENKTPVVADLNLHKNENNFCSVNITSLIPEKIENLHDTTTAYPGPNCWNTSLFINKIVQSRRATAEEEMTFWMNSPLCRELKEAEIEKPGDIIALRGNSTDKPIEMHGFIFLTKDFAFSKSGYDTQFPYEFVSSEYVYQAFALGDYGDYKPDPECRRVIGKPDANKCSVYGNVYRCISYEQYFRTAKFSSKKAFKKLDLKISVFEDKLSNAVVLERDFTKEKGAALDSELAEIENEYKKYIKFHPKDSILWESIRVRIISYHIQIALLQDEIPS
jgi:hypothetical protein